MDAEISREAKKVFTRQGLEIRTGVAVTGTKRTKQGVTVSVAEGGSRQGRRGAAGDRDACRTAKGSASRRRASRPTRRAS
jgi:pyruvate/2-oxoglutarate dehydrogenase complex dihydrolipoamide dehydrogenase (E3) component